MLHVQRGALRSTDAAEGKIHKPCGGILATAHDAVVFRGDDLINSAAVILCDLLGDDCKAAGKQIFPHRLLVRHRLQNQPNAVLTNPRRVVQNADDQLAAHARDENIVGGVNIKSEKAVGLHNRDDVRQAVARNVLSRPKHRAVADVRGDHPRRNAVKAKRDRQIGVIGSDVNGNAAASNQAIDRRKSLSQDRVFCHDLLHISPCLHNSGSRKPLPT